MMTSARFSRLCWLGFAVAVLAVAAIWAYSVYSLPTIDQQRAVVPVSTVWGMHACLIAFLAGLGGIALPLYGILGRRRCLTALALAVLGYLACGLAPYTTRIFFDEHIYAQIGQTIAHTGRAEAANYARVEYGQFEMYTAIVNKQPNGLPYLLSWVYRFAGVSEDSSHYLNRAMVGLAAAAIYLGLALVPWALPAGAGLAAAVLFMFTPLVMWWGHTVAVEPSAAATVAVAFFAVCAHARLRDPENAQGLPASGLMLAGATAFAVYFRPESLLVFPLVATVLWSADDRFIEDLSAWGALALATALATPSLLHLYSVRNENWGAHDGRRFDFDFVGKNFHSNGGYFIDMHWFPVAGTVLALAGVLWLLGRNRTAGLALGGWFALAWGIFIVFYAGGYYYGASSRYGVVSCAPVAIFMGIGLAALYGLLRRLPVLFYGLMACGLINWAAAMHYVPTLSREAVEALADVDFVVKEAPLLPGGSLVISPDPCVWMLQGVNASQYFTLNEMLHTQLRELANQYPGGVYIHWSFWHNAEPAFARETAKLLVETKAVLLARTQSHTHKIALYRIDTPEAFALFGGPPPPPPKRDSDMDRMLALARAEAANPPAAPAPPAK